MRHILIAAAAVAASGLIMSSAVKAQQASPPYEPGGPMQVGNWCSVDTDDNSNSAYGYMVPCGGQALASAPRKAKKRR